MIGFPRRPRNLDKFGEEIGSNMHTRGSIINDQYRVEDILWGGMAYVYVVFDQVSERTLALKTLKDEILYDESLDIAEWKSRFEREARNWISLGSHENIVHAISYIRGEEPFLILEYIGGPNLAMLVKEEPGGMAVSQLLKFGIEIAQGLAYAHERVMPRGSRGVVHRDLKPGNVLITPNCQAKLTDFGLSRARDDTNLTKGYLGTMAYMPPEQFKDSHSTTEKADIYSFGVVLYQMVTGNMPFSVCTEYELMYRIFSCEPEPVESYRPDIAVELAALIRKCMMKEPQDRPDSTREVLDSLLEIRKNLRVDSSARQPCWQCGYIAQKEHFQCPVCESAPLPSGSDGNDTPWHCTCGEENQAKFWYCLKCGKAAKTIEPATQFGGLPSSPTYDSLVPPDSFERVNRCILCGSGNLPLYKFCSHCGTPLEVKTLPPT